MILRKWLIANILCLIVSVDQVPEQGKANTEIGNSWFYFGSPCPSMGLLTCVSPPPILAP